jgi:hypothetical protein
VQILIAFFFVCEKLAAARNKLLIYVPLLKSSLRRETYCAREVVKRRIIVMCVPNCTSFLILLDRFISLFRRKNPSREEENNTRSIFPSDKSSGSRHEPTVQSVWGACCGLSFRSVYLRRMQGELLSARKNSPRFTIKVGDHRRERQTALTTAGRLTVSGCELASLKHN